MPGRGTDEFVLLVITASGNTLNNSLSTALPLYSLLSRNSPGPLLHKRTNPITFNSYDLVAKYTIRSPTLYRPISRPRGHLCSTTSAYNQYFLSFFAEVKPLPSFRHVNTSITRSLPVLFIGRWLLASCGGVAPSRSMVLDVFQICPRTNLWKL
jgi:hypothetical protein